MKLVTPRYIISFIGRRLYRNQYSIIKEKLLSEYKTFQAQKIKSHNIMLDKLLISGEDHRFRYHFGFDIIAILRAIKKRIFNNKIEGASTIEQQLVRILSNDFEKTFRRKIKEIFLATTLCELIPRKHIPCIYLYVAYYGTGMNGLHQVYKKMSIANPQLISKEICAEIIARIKYPEPKVISFNRLKQIELRKKHLLVLYSKHSAYKYFKIHG
jgi:hypothetical protein